MDVSYELSLNIREQIWSSMDMRTGEKWNMKSSIAVVWILGLLGTGEGTWGDDTLLCFVNVEC